MPGYELDRFVDLTQIERTELTCSICQDILRNPVFTNCCLQTYCEDCINEWLNMNNTCPHDRKDLNASQLTQPPRLLLNLLGKLKICCANKAKGCEEIIFVEDLNNHMQSCRFDKKICKKCNFEILDEHNCIKNLVEANEKLQRKFKTQSIRIQSLEIENENYLQTLQDSSQSNTLNISPNFKISENQMLIDARKHMDTSDVNSRSTPAVITDNIVTIVKDAVNKGITLLEVCQTIRNNVELKCGGFWLCHAFYDEMGSISCIVDNNFFVSLRFGKLKISVHKVYEDIDFKKLAQRLRSGELKEEFVVFKTDMTENNIRMMRELIFNGIKKWNNWTEFISDIFNELPKKFGGVWNCIVYKRYLGHFCVLPKTRRYINFYISDLDFAIFQVLD